MELTIVISLLSFGLALIVIEIIFVPGTTVVGFFGFGLMVAGAWLSFQYFGNQTGWITVACSAIATGIVFYFSFKSRFWGRFALKSSIKSTVNEGETKELTAGQEGIAISALRPVGKGELDSRIYEVKTQGEYVERGTKIRIVKISLHQIIVEPTS